MVIKVTKIGDSQGVIFDDALMNMAGLKIGDEVNVTLLEDGSLMLTPVRLLTQSEGAAETAKNTIQKNSELFRRLS